MSALVCAATDCDLRDPVSHRCKVPHCNHHVGPLSCAWGRFVTNITNTFGDLGTWKFRNIGKTDDVIVATLKGKGGRVEIWGGSAHRTEVWAIPKGTNGCLIGTLATRVTVEMACNRIGLQGRLSL